MVTTKPCDKRVVKWLCSCSEHDARELETAVVGVEMFRGDARALG